MATTEFTLTTTPTQVLDGTKSGYLQEKRGSFTRFVISTTAPSPTTEVYHTIMNNDVSVAAGFPVWAWAEDEPITLTVSTAE